MRMVLEGSVCMKRKLLLFSLLQIACNVIYILLCNGYHAVFALQNFWTTFFMYARPVATSLELAVALIAIGYIAACQRPFWKMIGTTVLYLIAVYAVEFVLQWAILYGFSAQSYLITALGWFGTLCIYACIYFPFQKRVFRNYISPDART